MLDLAFTTNPTIVTHSVSVHGISDHDIIVTDFDVKIQYQNKQRRQIYQFARADWESLNDDFNTLSNKIKSQYNTGACTESLWSTFKNTLTESIDKHIPSKLSSSRCNLPWLNGKLHLLLKRKRRLYKKAKETNNWTNYIFIQKTCRRSMRKAEWEYINNTITQGLQTNNSKPFWKYIKSRKQDNIGVAPLKKNGSLVCDSKEKATILLDQFQSVFTRDCGSAPPHLDPPQHPIISDIKINTAGVCKLLKAINPHKACGPDQIPNVILKNCADTLAPALRDIFQRSLDTAVLPSDWRTVNVSAVF